MTRPKKPVRGSPRLFQSDLIEFKFSRIQPWHVVAAWAPVLLWTTWQSLHAGLGVAESALLFCGGLLFWTLLEYTLHRFLFHFQPNQSEWQQQTTFLIHGVHHDYPWDPDRLVLPPSLSLFLGALVWLGARALLGPPHHHAFFAGLGSGYVAYDLIHYATHHLQPRTAVGRFLRNYHLVHHFGPDGQRYGVSSPLWDYVLGTAPRRADKVAVKAANAAYAPETTPDADVPPTR